MKPMKRRGVFLEKLKKDGRRLEMPESLKPENIEKVLCDAERKRKFRKRRIRAFLAAAACICLVSAGALTLVYLALPVSEREELRTAENTAENTADAVKQEEDEVGEGLQDRLQFADKSYEEIYELLGLDAGRTELLYQYGISKEAAAEDSQGEIMEESTAEFSADSALKEYGTTNLQKEGVEEADTVKNDGRYLYQLAEGTDQNGARYQGIQIADTKDGLRQTAFVGRFEHPREFYVWEDLLIVLEDGYYMADTKDGDADSGTEEKYQMQVCADVLWLWDQYTKIHIYDISDRENPRLGKTFTLDGFYSTSRVADGYFYGFSFFTPRPGAKEEDYEAYIPKTDGVLIPAEKISCPDGASWQNYLVMVSIDLSSPARLSDSRSVLASNGIFYVSTDSIYLASWHSVYDEEVPVFYGDTGEAEKEGRRVSEEETVWDHTQILSFAFEDGKFLARAEGRVPGRVMDSFCLDQDGTYLRAVTTVTECVRRRVTDDRTGEILGYEYGMEEEGESQSSGLYILNEDLEITGELTGLAEGEQIYSARFLKDTAYFVTFRQTDPLFAVDVSNPEKPSLLSELKVSGFSEYLHFYGENLLFGLGMEADEKTGAQQGLKLSMFDLTNPKELTEAARRNLSGYDYSPALYDHRSLLIDPGQNLIGFEVQGSVDGVFSQAYLLYSYENGEFRERLHIKIKSGNGAYHACRGTFIGDSFYLLQPDGSIREYSLLDGSLLGEL